MTAWTPEKRAAHSERIRVLMNEPAMRRKISERTKEGMKKAPGTSPELQMLRGAWAIAQPSTRRRFLDEIFSPICSASHAAKDVAGR
jgi:hypothetical protein